MKYEISKATAPAMPNLGKGTEISNCCSRRPQKTCTNPSFRCFSQSWRTHQRCGISVSRQQLEGADGHDGQSGGKKWR